MSVLIATLISVLIETKKPNSNLTLTLTHWFPIFTSRTPLAPRHQPLLCVTHVPQLFK